MNMHIQIRGGGGTSSCVIGSTLPGDSVSGTSGVTAPRPPATPRNREVLCGTAGGAETNGLVPN